MSDKYDSVFDVLIATLNQYGVSDQQVLQTIVEEVTLRRLKPEETLIRVGDRPQQFYVIRSGLVRYYYSAENGKVWNKVFYREGQLCGSLNAFVTGEACRYNIEAIEATEVYALPIELIRQEAGKDEQMRQLISRLTEEVFLRNEAREALLLTGNAEARYQWLVSHESWLLSRVPQYHLARYLGMDAVSFSRIKNRANSEGH